MWLVVFHWDVEDSEPFSLHVRNIFTDEEVPESWYAFMLKDDYRKKKIFLHALEGEYSVFCKVEKGTIFMPAAKRAFFVLSVWYFFHFYQELLMPIGKKSLIV